MAQATGDAQRFKSLVAEYQKAPQVTRDRLYIEAMQQIYTNTTKILIDSRQGSNLLYLPLDKIMQQVSQSTPASASGDASSSGTTSPTSPTPNSGLLNGNPDARTRDGRSRDRDAR